MSSRTPYVVVTIELIYWLAALHYVLTFYLNTIAAHTLDINSCYLCTLYLVIIYM